MKAIAARGAGRAYDWTACLERRLEETPDNPRLWHTLGTLWRAELELERAIAAFAEALRLNPTSAVTAHALARATLEAGQPALERYNEALSLSPDDGSILLGRASAQVAEGHADEAIAELEALLRHSPHWADGHRQLVEFRIARGADADHLSTLDDAIDRHPSDGDLRAVKLDILYRGQEFEQLAHFAISCEQAIGPSEALATYRAIAASELGDTSTADSLFDQLLPTHSTELASHAMRHAIRSGRPEAAAKIGEPLTTNPGANQVWPWRRMMDDPRAEWLYDQPNLVKEYEILDRVEIEALTKRLRQLHNVGFTHLGQSVRDGTQTDGPLLARSEPEIVALRHTILKQTEAHLASLPYVEGHPTLARKPDRARIAGSWSVRFHGGGRHAHHVHPLGWLSAALYISVPEHQPADRDAGWLVLGQPPDELNVPLQPIRLIEPRPGRLVLFPSIMWHGTRPFPSGERMTVAFDVALPGQAAS